MTECPASTVVKPYVTMTFLPGCRECHAKHPLAHNPPLPAHECPACGEPAGEPGEPHTEEAELVGPLSRFLNLFGKARP